MHFLLGVEVTNGRFTLIDTIRFKKGQIVHAFELLDTSQYSFTDGPKVKAKMLALVAYNGSKLKEFTFCVNKALESRK